jgi:hypothetical protein
MGGAAKGSMRWRQKVVRERTDAATQVEAALRAVRGQPTVAYDLACGHVVWRERRFQSHAYCDTCKAVEAKPKA